MESHDLNHYEQQTRESHSCTLEGGFNEMKAANEAPNARFNEFSRSEQQFLDLNAALPTIIAQTSEKEKRNCEYSDVDLTAEKKAINSVEYQQQGTCGA